MKGPFERLKYDLRRVWECPLCHHRDRTDGRVTTRFCICSGESQFTPMKLIEDGERTRARSVGSATSEASPGKGTEHA